MIDNAEPTASAKATVVRRRGTRRRKVGTIDKRVPERSADVRVTIAGITTAIASCEPDLKIAVRGPARRFVNPEASPDITLQIAWNQPNHHGSSCEKVFDSGGVWQLFRDGDRFVFQLRSPKCGTQPYLTAAFSSDFATGIIYLRRDCFDAGRPIYPIQYPLDELLITNWLALGRGVEVHACAVVDADGAGYLFAGHSGAGKTTMARQWCRQKDVTVLSDDRIILRKVGNEVWMHGTPWHGDEPLASPRCAPMRRGFFLRHASKNELTPVAGAPAVMELFARSFPPFFSPSGLDFTLSVLTEISEVVPFFDLGFVPDQRLPAFVRAL
jgi:hypothetical protein